MTNRWRRVGRAECNREVRRHRDRGGLGNGGRVLTWVALTILVAGGCTGAPGEDETTEDVTSSADGGTNDTTERVDTGPDNAAPEARAGEDRVVAVGEPVSLDASSSSDPDGDALSYDWSVVELPDEAAPELAMDENVAARMTPDLAGTYELEVEVSDGTDSATDRVVLEARGEPVADAGIDRAAEVGTAVELDGSGSSTPGDGELAFEWAFVGRPESSGVEIQQPGAETSSFVPDAVGDYIVELTVDNGGQEATDRVTIDVREQGQLLGTTVYVEPSGDDAHPGTEYRPVETVGRGLEIANDRERVERVQLAEGTYPLADVSVPVTADVSVAGPSDDEKEAVIERDGRLFEVGGQASATFRDVTLEADEGTAVTVGDESTATLIDTICRAKTCLESGGPRGGAGGRLVVKRSRLVGQHNSEGIGISASNADGISVEETVIEQFPRGIYILNAALSMTGSTVESNGVGVQVFAVGTSHQTQILETDFRGNAEGGIELDLVEDVSLRKVTVEDTDSNGVHITGGACTIEQSRIASVAESGLVVERDAEVTVRDTEITGNLKDGVRIEGPKAVVDFGTDQKPGGNTIESNNEVQFHDTRRDLASGRVTLSDTNVGAQQLESGTYRGPTTYRDDLIVIEGRNEIVVY